MKKSFKNKDKTQGIILAAGLSLRMGTSKLELPFEGKTIIEHTVSSTITFCEKVFVVCGKRMQELSTLLDGFNQVDVIFNENYEQGMFTSIKKGVAAISAEYFFLLPGDYPVIQKSTFELLLNAAQTNTQGDIFIPIYSELKGHPILLHRRMIDLITDALPHTTLRDIIRNHGFTAVSVDDKNILFDIDTKEDYEKLCKLQR